MNEVTWAKLEFEKYQIRSLVVSADQEFDKKWIVFELDLDLKFDCKTGIISQHFEYNLFLLFPLHIHNVVCVQSLCKMTAIKRLYPSVTDN